MDFFVVRETKWLLDKRGTFMGNWIFSYIDTNDNGKKKNRINLILPFHGQLFTNNSDGLCVSEFSFVYFNLYVWKQIRLDHLKTMVIVHSTPIRNAHGCTNLVN